MAKRERKATVGIKRVVMSHVFSDAEPYIDQRIVPALIRALEKYHDAAIKRAVRDAYDAGWKDGWRHGTDEQNDGWNRLARKYGMKEVK